MHLYSLCQTWLNLKTHTVSETENRTSCLTTVSQTITVSSCQSDISNQCRIKKPCITGMAVKSWGGGGGCGKDGGGMGWGGMGSTESDCGGRGAD